jgi:hypothetical protein
MEEQAARYRGGRAATVTDWDLFENGKILVIRSTPALWQWARNNEPSNSVRTAKQNALIALTQEDPVSTPGSTAEKVQKTEATGTEETKTSEGETGVADKPDGPFDIDGFRFAGVAVRFGRAALQYRLMLALWDAKMKQLTLPRDIQDVIVEVWGDDNEIEDSTFRQLCSDTRRRLQAANCPLTIRVMEGKVQLTRV